MTLETLGVKDEQWQWHLNLSQIDGGNAQSEKLKSAKDPGTVLNDLSC